MSMQSAELLNPCLWDLLLIRVLPGLPATRLTSLRASCSYLQNMLDSPSAACLWAAATRCQLYNVPQRQCNHQRANTASATAAHQENEEAEELHHCSRCIQQELRWRNRVVQRLMSGGSITQWPGAATSSQPPGWAQQFNKAETQQTVIAKWSPCCRWVVVVKRSSNKPCKNGSFTYDAPEWTMQVFDSAHQGFRQIKIHHSSSRYGLDTTGWQLTDVHWLPATIGPTRWIVYVSKSPEVFGMSRSRLTCHDLTSSQEHQHDGKEGQWFVPALGKAAANSQRLCKVAVCSDRHVDIYELPGLEWKLQLTQGGAQAGSCMAAAIEFSPDATKVAIWWAATSTHNILTVHDTQTGNVIADFDEIEDEGGAVEFTNAVACGYCSILSWSPTSSRLLACLNGVYCIVELPSGPDDRGSCAAIQVCPDLSHASYTPANRARSGVIPVREALRKIECGWLPSNKVVMVMGYDIQVLATPTLPSTDTFNRSPPPSIYAVHADGSIVGKWTCHPGWYLDSANNTVSDWAYRCALLPHSPDHPLEPMWSQGIPGTAQPYSPLIGLLSPHVDSNVGFGTFTYLMSQGLCNYDPPCTELSPCGKVIVARPMKPGCRLFSQDRAAHFVWDSHQEMMLQQSLRFDVWKQLAWHPAAASLPLYAAVLQNGDLVVMNGTQSKPLRRWSFQQLTAATAGLSPRSPLRPWEQLAWSPDGSKLCVAGGDMGVTVIDFMRDSTVTRWNLSAFKPMLLKLCVVAMLIAFLVTPLGGRVPGCIANFAKLIASGFVIYDLLMSLLALCFA